MITQQLPESVQVGAELTTAAEALSTPQIAQYNGTGWAITNDKIRLPAPTGVVATDWAAISAAYTLAAEIVAVGGHPEVQFQSCPPNSANSIGVTPYAIGNHTIPVVQGVASVGAQPILSQEEQAWPGYLPDGEWNYLGGTVIQGDGTAPGISDGAIDLSAPASNAGAAQIGGTNFLNLALDNFSYGLKLGAQNVMSLVWSRIDQLYATNCGWGVFIQNHQHVDFGTVATCLCTSGNQWYGTNFGSAGDPGNWGNCRHSYLFAKTPNGNNKVRGIVFKGINPAGGAGAHSIGTVEVCQANTYNRVSISQTATFTNASANIGVADGTQFAVGMPVQFTATVAGFTAGVNYYVLSLNANTLTLASSIASTAAINATATTTGTLTTLGFHGIEIVGAGGGVLQGHFDLLDVEGAGAGGFTVCSGAYFEGYVGTINRIGCPSVIRTPSRMKPNYIQGTVVDIDTTSAQAGNLINSIAQLIFPNDVPPGVRISGPNGDVSVAYGRARVAQTRPIVSGRYIASRASGFTTVQQAVGTCTFTPIDLPDGEVLNVGVYVNTAGDSAAVVRLGLYYGIRTSYGPGQLVQDFGTVAANAAGYVEVSGLTLPVYAGMYWLAAVVQGATTTVPILSAHTTDGVIGFTGGAQVCQGTDDSDAWYATGITGALPNNPSLVTTCGTPIRVAVRLNTHTN